MGSGKHKHKSKKRKHTSESPENDYKRDVGKGKHKKHKKDKKQTLDYSSDELRRDVKYGGSPKRPDLETNQNQSSGGGDVSLSVADTNKLRLKLGLKPLEDDRKKSENDGTKKAFGGTDMGGFIHKPATNINAVKQSEKLKEKLALRKEKRSIEKKLMKGMTLVGEDDSDDDVAKWVEKNRAVVSEREKAEKKAKELDAMDEVFGIGVLIEEDLKSTQKMAYTSRHLKGLKVQHSMDNFIEGNDVVLTLKDKGVLDEEDDTLVNVNMIDDELYEKNIQRKKQKPGYDAYGDDEFEEDAFGSLEKKILKKYDEEIDGEKKRSFAIGIDSTTEAIARRNAIREKLKQQPGKVLETLGGSTLQPASDYYTDQELQFKKRKRKVRKIRKSQPLRADDLLLMDADRDRNSHKRNGQDVMDVDDMDPVEEEDVKLEEDRDTDLQMALNKARRLKQLEDRARVREIEEPVDDVQMDFLQGGKVGNIVLNSTSEFCRALGSIPIYGQSREDYDMEGMHEMECQREQKRIDEENRQKGGWDVVQMKQPDHAPAPEIRKSEVTILDEEPDIIGGGVVGALKIALSKGYIQKETDKRPTGVSRFAHLQAQNYSIEDKAIMGDDDKYQRRERFSGPTTDFKEKAGYKPNIKLDYVDDEGHALSEKEAFRYLSHKFHGKGPGKNKIEKRLKKSELEMLMKQMSSTDTPLGTLNMLQKKQAETNSPFVVLSGSKKGQHQMTQLSKYH